MKKQNRILILMMLISTIGLAQKSNLTSNNYTVFPEDNFLFQAAVNKVKIKPKGNSKISEVLISNGKITNVQGDSIYLISDLNPGTAKITIYEIGKDGKKKAALDKTYTIVDYPKLNFNGKSRTDSEIPLLMLNAGLFYAVFDKTVGRVDVSSFKMDILENGKIICDSTSGNKVSKKMREYAMSLKDGAIIYIRDVKYSKPDGTIVNNPMFRLYVRK